MKRIIILLLMWLVVNSLPAQNNIPNVQTPCTTTGQGTAGNFIISYTIGEMPLVTTEKNNGLVITQGVLQPVPFIADTAYECYSQTEVKVYPNPTPGIFNLQLHTLKKGKVKTLLFDAAGKMVQIKEFDYNAFSGMTYNIQKLSNGVYYLQLFFTEEGSNKAKKCVYTIQKIN
jgi:Secretion system C-terminal sorting domain